MKIAFIGLGLMGARMAANLLKKGHRLSVYNRTHSKAGRLASEGARVATSPAEAARDAEVAFTMLATPDAVREAALGAGGLLETLARGRLWVDSSTVNPSFTRIMAEECRSRGIRFVDAPVSGTIGPAERGELAFLVGAAGEDLAECRPLLEAMGKSIVHLGPVGSGVSMKLVNNLLLGNAMAAFAEALALGEAMGLPRKLLLDTLVGGAVAAPFLTGKRAKLEAGGRDAEFPLALMLKDLQLVSLTAFERGIALPTTHAAKELFSLARGAGLGDADFSAVGEVLKRRG
jgi:3-hydroxyisobutyrate dehydrogenase-like beta-hydroxyacid dehydrogenase